MLAYANGNYTVMPTAGGHSGFTPFKQKHIDYL